MPPPLVDLIETMVFDPEAGLARVERHLARMKASANALGMAFDRHCARNELQAATFRLRRAALVRLVLAASGAIAIEASPPPMAPAAPVPVVLLPCPTGERRPHRASDRAPYLRARRDSGCFEVAFFDADGSLTEGSVSSLFVARGDTLVTPPLARGIVPGVLRAELIGAGRAVEGDLTTADLADGFYIGNAVHGLIRAVVAPQQARL